MDEYYVIVAGGRDFDNYELMKSKLDYYLSNKSKTHSIVIISGTAKGADKLGERYAFEHNYKVWRFPADWEGYGKKAGPIRNEQMSENANACIIFWDGHSKGSKNMIENAKKKNLILRVVPY